MKNIFSCFEKKEKLFSLAIVIAIVLQVWLDLKLPDYMSEITRLVQTEGSAMGDILTAGGFMLLCAFASLLVTFTTAFFSAQIASGVAMRLREKLYKKTISFSASEINKFSTPSLITRSTNDITQIQMFIAIGYTAAIRAPLMAGWAITKIMGKNPSFTTVTVIAVACLLATMGVVISLTLPKSQKLQTLTDKLNLVTRELLTGVRVVRAYNAEEYQTEKSKTVNTDVMHTNTFISRTTAIFGPFMTFLMSSLTLSIYAVGTSLLNSAQMQDKITIFSDMVVFTAYSMQIIMSFMMLTFTFMMLPRVIVSNKRIAEVLKSKNEIQDGAIQNVDVSGETTLEFKNVTFNYPDGEEAVLEDISFFAQNGQTIAFIGSTGSGKSTLINLVPRFYDVTKGEILLNGKNIKQYTQHGLRETLGIVTQKAILFSGTLQSNIAFGIEGEDVCTEAVKTAVKIAQAKDFVDKVGVDGVVSQGGLNLSGGQKQRVSIARAIYKKPKIYIFDDCFSALDYKTDKVLRRELEAQTKGAIKLMVAQRISTIKDADMIIVLDEGKIAGKGTHSELLVTCKVYQEIAYSQLSKEELNHA